MHILARSVLCAGGFRLAWPTAWGSPAGRGAELARLRAPSGATPCCAPTTRRFPGPPVSGLRVRRARATRPGAPASRSARPPCFAVEAAPDRALTTRMLRALCRRCHQKSPRRPVATRPRQPASKPSPASRSAKTRCEGRPAGRSEAGRAEPRHLLRATCGRGSSVAGLPTSRERIS
jgi:hypothetical protein